MIDVGKKSVVYIGTIGSYCIVFLFMTSDRWYEVFSVVYAQLSYQISCFFLMRTPRCPLGKFNKKNVFHECERMYGKNLFNRTDFSDLTRKRIRKNIDRELIYRRIKIPNATALHFDLSKWVTQFVNYTVRSLCSILAAPLNLWKCFFSFVALSSRIPNYWNVSAQFGCMQHAELSSTREWNPLFMWMRFFLCAAFAIKYQFN